MLDSLRIGWQWSDVMGEKSPEDFWAEAQRNGSDSFEEAVTAWVESVDPQAKPHIKFSVRTKLLVELYNTVTVPVPERTYTAQEILEVLLEVWEWAGTAYRPSAAGAVLGTARRLGLTEVLNQADIRRG